MRKPAGTAKKLSVFVPAVALSAFILSLVFLVLLWILTACLLVVCLCAHCVLAVLGLCSYCFSFTDIALCSSLYCYLLMTLKNSDGNGTSSSSSSSSVDRLKPVGLKSSPDV